MKASSYSNLAPFGEHLILGLSGVKLTEEEKRLLGEVRPAGILLLSRNFCHGSPYEVWLERLKELLDEIRQYTERDKLLISIDHEGGSIVRAPLPITRSPLASCFRERAHDVGLAHARELASIGVNVSWAPVADIHSNPLNPIIGNRAFATTPTEAARLSEAYLIGLREGGVLGCAKHFPGHGDTAHDSHLELPVLTQTMAELRERELIPFERLIATGVPLIMTAHVYFPAILGDSDPTDEKSGLAATFSHELLTELLRNELRFRGVTVADDLDMRAVADQFASDAGIEKALVAGCDMFIIARYISPSLERTYKVAESFARAIESSSIAAKRREEALGRINSLFELMQMHPVQPLPQQTFRDHHQLALECSL